jgi:hypothetical protein
MGIIDRSRAAARVLPFAGEDMQRHLMRRRDATAAKKFRWRGDHLTISRTLRSQQGQAQLPGSLRINPRPLRRAASICSSVKHGQGKLHGG